MRQQQPSGGGTGLIGGVVLHHFLFGGYFLRYELFSIGGGQPDRTNRGGIINTGSTLHTSWFLGWGFVLIAGFPALW